MGIAPIQSARSVYTYRLFDLFLCLFLCESLLNVAAFRGTHDFLDDDEQKSNDEENADTRFFGLNARCFHSTNRDLFSALRGFIRGKAERRRLWMFERV